VPEDPSQLRRWLERIGLEDADVLAVFASEDLAALDESSSGCCTVCSRRGGRSITPTSPALWTESFPCSRWGTGLWGNRVEPAACLMRSETTLPGLKQVIVGPGEPAVAEIGPVAAAGAGGRAAAQRPALGGLELIVPAPLGPNGEVPAPTGRSAPWSEGQPDPAAARPAGTAAAGPHPGARGPRRLPRARCAHDAAGPTPPAASRWPAHRQPRARVPAAGAAGGVGAAGRPRRSARWPACRRRRPTD
jgi:hypothetical protein